MSNLLDRFRQDVKGSVDRLIDFLPKITSAGDFQQIVDLNVIIASWNNILSSPRRTHIHDPDYGSDLNLMVFQPVDDQTIDQIKTEIENRIQKYDNRAGIDDIQVNLLLNRKGFEVNVFIDYQGEKGTLNLKFDDSTYASSTGQ